MNDLKVFDNKEMGLRVRTILNDDGGILVNAEDTAIGYGWCRKEVKNGKEYRSVMWSRMNGYCREIGFAHECAKDDYIPESVFYRLGMKANNEIANRFQIMNGNEGTIRDSIGTEMVLIYDADSGIVHEK